MENVLGEHRRGTSGGVGAFRRWFGAIRAISLTATIGPAACVLLALPASGAGGMTRWLVTALAVLGVALLQIAANLHNDAQDDERGIDGEGALGGAGLIQKGLLERRDVRRAAIIAGGLGVAAGIPALAFAPPSLIYIAAAGALVAYGYSSDLLAFKYRALGDLVVFAACGPLLTAGVALVAVASVPMVAWAIGGLFGALALVLLHTNNWQDASTDRARGAITFAQLLGERGSRGYLVLLVGGAVASAFAAAMFLAREPGTFLGAHPSGGYLYAGLVSVLGVRFLRRALGAHRTSPTLRVEAAQLHLLAAVLLSALLTVNRFAS